jgi:hypothetical protein
VELAKENVAAIDRQLAELDAQFTEEADAIAAAGDPMTEPFEVLSLKPTKANIAVKLVALAWVPR